MLDWCQAQTGLKVYTCLEYMKGSAGIATGSVSVGRGASGGMASRSIGSSLSPEARFGGPTSSFSSRGLGKYNEAFSKSININFGREAKPSFATSMSLRSSRSMFDLSRPVVKENVTKAPKISKEPVTKRVSKAVEVRSIFSTPNVSNNRVEQSPKTSPKMEAFRNTVVLWERPKIAGPQRQKERAVRPLALRTISKPREVAVPNIVRKREMPKPQTVTQHIEARIKVNPKSEAIRSFRLDLKQAEVAVRAMTAVGFAQPKSYESVTQTLMKKYEGKPGVEVFTQPVPQPKTEVKAQVKAAKVQDPETQTLQEISKKNDKPKPKGKEEEQEGIRFYFRNYAEANKARVAGVIAVARKLLSNRQEGQVVTGQDLYQELSYQKSEEYESEVSRSVKEDGTWKGFLQKIAGIKSITEIEGIEVEAERISDQEKAVKLSLSEEGENLGQEGAVRVYENPLEGQRAYFKENKNSFGKFKEGRNGEMWFIPEAKGLPIPS